MVELTYDPIDSDRVLKVVQRKQAGAAVLFVGTTREFTKGRRTESLVYDGYREMAASKLAELESHVRERWTVVDVCIVHRLGQVDLGEVSVALAVSAAHRQAAFEAGQWLIDKIKQDVPIWKQENWSDGTREWVHPGVDVRNSNELSSIPDLSVAAGVDSPSDIRGPLVDRLGRVHSNLRISVTDRCNIRCLYCMPNENVRFKPRSEILTFEEIERFVRVVSKLGVDRLRITGGEPLVREDLSVLIEKLSRVPGINDIALTTNGILLPDQASDLKKAGLKRLNISLDSLDESTFQQITRREGLDRVLSGISAALRIGFEKIRLNAVTIQRLTEDQIIPLTEFARGNDLELRFIEFMPLDGDGKWQPSQVVSGSEIRRRLESHFGKLVVAPRPDDRQPAIDYLFADGTGKVGFIDSVTAPFCPNCNRLRITAEGRVRNCLFSSDEWDVRSLLRGDSSDRQIADLVRGCISQKRTAHGTDFVGFTKPGRPMNELGG